MHSSLQALRDNKTFEWFVITIIILSSLVIGAKTYNIDPGILATLEILDLAVTLFFLFELLVRMGAEKRIIDFFKNGWNIFDFVIVTVSLIPIDNNEYALLARMLRLFRVLRLISFIPELRVLVTALFTAMPRMAYVALLMFVIFYMYAVVGSLFYAKINPELWGDVGISLLTLFRVATFEDWTDVMYETMVVYPLSWIYYLTFIFFSAFVFLNMMIGIVVSVLEEEHQKTFEDNLQTQEKDTQTHIQQLEDKIDALTALVEKQMAQK